MWISPVWFKTVRQLKMYKKYDPKLKTDVMTIFAGECYISNGQEVISTVLGSCISVCLYDSQKGIGGMNHFMLPANNLPQENFFDNSQGIKKERLTENSLRYGITAMEVLIAELQKRGASRPHMKAKVFGGGHVLSMSHSNESIGEKNISFARAFLKMEKIEIEKENVGSNFGRKIFFLVGRNSVFVKKVPISSAISEEKEYMDTLMDLKVKSDITLF